MKQTDPGIHQRATELLQLARHIIDELPEDFAFLAEQLERAAYNVPLSFTEGHARFSVREQRHFFQVARASAREVGTLLDMAHTCGVVSTADHARGKDICAHLAVLLPRFR